MGRQARRDWRDRERLLEESASEPPVTCWLCARPLGRRIEWHHPKPKSRGGRETVPVHPICHRTIHANFDNAELEIMASSGLVLGEDSRLRAFLDWIANKEPDFHAPTRTRR